MQEKVQNGAKKALRALVCLLASPLVITLTKPLMVWPFEKKGG